MEEYESKYFFAEDLLDKIYQSGGVSEKDFLDYKEMISEHKFKHLVMYTGLDMSKTYKRGFSDGIESTLKKPKHE